MGPYPHPKSYNVVDPDGINICSIKTLVPKSIFLKEKTPVIVLNIKRCLLRLSDIV